MILAGILVLLIGFFFLYRKFGLKKVEDDGLMSDFNKEFEKIRNDSVQNFLEEKDIFEGFGFFSNLQFCPAANDEGKTDYPITSLQDLEPQDLA